jgi:hypothetical protein
VRAALRCAAALFGAGRPGWPASDQANGSPVPSSPAQPSHWPNGIGGYDLTTKAFTPGWDAYTDYYVKVAKELVKLNGGYPFLGLSWEHFRSGLPRDKQAAFVAAARGTNMREVRDRAAGGCGCGQPHNAQFCARCGAWRRLFQAGRQGLPVLPSGREDSQTPCVHPQTPALPPSKPPILTRRLAVMAPLA